jgi:NNP family nitrate/nitrite transporter-like MFS transporter
VLGTGGMYLVLAAVVVLTLVQLRQVFVVNGPARRGEYPVEDQYPLRSVAVLCGAYFCSFGSELAVVSMLPLFFAQTWDLGPAMAGITASVFAFMNLAARPAGGLLSYKLGSRRRTLQVLLGGLTVGYAAMALLGSSWPLPLAMLVVACCSFFVQSDEGAVYAIVPLVKKRVSGQISGMAGAYGNVGAVTFLTVYLFVSPTVFFLVVASAAVVGTFACRWLVEPAGSFAAELVDDDGAASVAGPAAARHGRLHLPEPVDLRPGAALQQVPTP